MTLVFDKNGYQKNDLEQAQKLVDQWKQANDVKEVTFSLTKGGPHSDNVVGSLADLCLFVRKQLGCQEDQRPPHVELRAF